MNIKDITLVDYAIGGYNVTTKDNNRFFIPVDDSNQYYQLIQYWVSLGNVISPVTSSVTSIKFSDSTEDYVYINNTKEIYPVSSNIVQQYILNGGTIPSYSEPKKSNTELMLEEIGSLQDQINNIRDNGIDFEKDRVAAIKQKYEI